MEPPPNLGSGDDTVGNPHRARISQFELFELILFLKLDKQLNRSSNSSRMFVIMIIIIIIIIVVINNIIVISSLSSTSRRLHLRQKCPPPPLPHHPLANHPQFSVACFRSDTSDHLCPSPSVQQ